MDFGQTLLALKANKRMARVTWIGPVPVWIALQQPDENSKMTQQYIYQHTAKNDLVPWVPITEDMFASDWGPG